MLLSTFTHKHCHTTTPAPSRQLPHGMVAHLKSAWLRRLGRRLTCQKDDVEVVGGGESASSSSSSRGKVQDPNTRSKGLAPSSTQKKATLSRLEAVQMKAMQPWWEAMRRKKKQPGHRHAGSDDDDDSSTDDSDSEVPREDDFSPALLNKSGDTTAAAAANLAITTTTTTPPPQRPTSSGSTRKQVEQRRREAKARRRLSRRERRLRESLARGESDGPFVRALTFLCLPVKLPSRLEVRRRLGGCGGRW
jgi:hypothetical protein